MVNLENEVKLFMVFDILGDTERTGPKLWHIDRFRLEDIKNHVFDLLLIERIIRKYLPVKLDEEKMFDYILCHDLPEAITGDITHFEGVSEEGRTRVTLEAIEYLHERFKNIFNFKEIILGFEEKCDLEAKVASLIDKVHSASTFVKYQSEQDIDMNNPEIIPELRNHPFVVKKINEGKDLADIFYEFHSLGIKITDEECEKYHISRDTADRIVDVIQTFLTEMYREKQDGTLFSEKDNFPKSAMKYNRAFK